MTNLQREGPTAWLRGADRALALLATLPPLGSAERRAFLSRFPATQCEAVGARADARAVCEHGLARIRVVRRTLAHHPEQVRRYGSARLAWLIECVLDLFETLDAARSPASPQARVDRLARAEARASAVRDDLTTALDVLSGGDETDRRLLTEAKDDLAVDHAGLVRSLRALALLAEAWLEREGPENRALVRSVGLTQKDVEDAHAALHAIASAATDATTEGGRAARAAPSVEQAAGRVLLELEVAASVFEHARRRFPHVPRLPRRPASRRVGAN